MSVDADSSLALSGQLQPLGVTPPPLPKFMSQVSAEFGSIVDVSQNPQDRGDRSISDPAFTSESEASGGTSERDREAHPDMSAVYRIYKIEAAKCVAMVVAFAFALLHLYAYPELFGTQVSLKDEVPAQELRFFHHGWTAMLVIFLVEFCSVSLKIWCTWHSPVLAMAAAQKLQGNIGVLFGEYIVVAATYVIMGCNLMPVFLEDRTGRRVYGVRYMEWAVDACGLVYLDCHVLFSQPWQKFYMAFVWSVAYMMFGLWSAIANTWTLHWVFLAASWLTFGIVCFMLIRFLQRDPKPMQPFSVGIKPSILGFIITWWCLYGVVFTVAFLEHMPQLVEQCLWTGMDVIMKLSHTVVLMAWRSSQWDIDAVVGRCKAEAQRFIAQMDKQKAVADRDRARLLQKLRSRTSEMSSGADSRFPELQKASEETNGEKKASEEANVEKKAYSSTSSKGSLHASFLVASSDRVAEKEITDNEPTTEFDIDVGPLEKKSQVAVLEPFESAIPLDPPTPCSDKELVPVSDISYGSDPLPDMNATFTGGDNHDVTACFSEVKSIYKGEVLKCLGLCAAFVLAVFHLYIYPEVFNVEIASVEEIPEREIEYFHHGWTAMLTVSLIEVWTVLLKVSCTWRQPAVARAQAQKFDGNLGALFGEYLVVGAAYVIMGWNWMPVFLEPRTGRRVYGVRYMEWLVDACGLVSLDCHCLFGRSFHESRWVHVWTVSYMMFGLWSAIASNWFWYWVFLSLSWLTFFFVCAILVKFLLEDPYPLDPFGKRPVKTCILVFIIVWWILYGVLFMLCFQAPDLVPQWLEQLLWTGMDIIMKLSHTIILIAWRETQWDVDTVVNRRKAAREMKAARKEIKVIRKAESQIKEEMWNDIPSTRRSNFTLTPGLEVSLPDIVLLQAEVGQGTVGERQLRSMMSPGEFAELQRLEMLGLNQAQMQTRWEWQVREQTFLRHGIHHIAYNPNHWFETLFSIRGRCVVSSPCWIIIGVSLVVMFIAERMPELIENITMSDKIHSLVGGAVMFLVVFRTQYAFRKWWEGRVAFGRIVLSTRTVAQQVCAYVADDACCNKICRYLVVAVVAARCHLRSERVDPRMLVGIIGEKEIAIVNKEANMPCFATWVVRSTLAEAVNADKVLPFHVAMDNGIRSIEVAIADAERLLTPMPFVYVAHLRSFLFMYLLFLPFVLVQDLGRLMVVAVSIASYLLIGLETTAVTLENPFGYDLNDLPLDLYCIEVSRELLGLLERRALMPHVDVVKHHASHGDDDGD
jgi:putative membrane protein